MSTELLIAILKYLSLPVCILLAALLFRRPLIAAFEALSEIKAGGFTLSIDRAAKRQALDFSTDELSSLTMDELHMFLIMGGEQGDEIDIVHKQGSHQRRKREFEHLAALGLLSIRKYEDAGPEGMPRCEFETLEKGRRVHKLLMDQLYQELVLKQPSSALTKP